MTIALVQRATPLNKRYRAPVSGSAAVPRSLARSSWVHAGGAACPRSRFPENVLPRIGQCRDCRRGCTHLWRSRSPLPSSRPVLDGARAAFIHASSVLGKSFRLRAMQRRGGVVEPELARGQHQFDSTTPPATLHRSQSGRTAERTGAGFRPSGRERPAARA